MREFQLRAVLRIAGSSRVRTTATKTSDLGKIVSGFAADVRLAKVRYHSEIRN